MSRHLVIAMLLSSACLVSCAAAGAGGAKATDLRLARVSFPQPRITVATSMPPQFDVVFDREMPTPGWRLDVDSVEVDAESGRIVARISEVAPEGMTAQVITPTTCRIPLGTMSPGHYVFELRVRRGTTGPYVPAQAFVLVAR